MKKKNKHKHRRNAGPRPPRAPRAPIAPKPAVGTSKMGLAEIGAIVLGGAATAGLDYLAQRGGPKVAIATTAALTAVSVAGTRLGEGAMQTASAGVLGACAGHIVETVLPKPRNAAEDDVVDFAAHRRQAALPSPPSPTLREAMARAQVNVAARYPDDDYAAHSFAD